MPDYGMGSWPHRRARISPSSVALVQGERKVSYAQLAERVDRLASALEKSGLEPSGRVAYLGANDISTFEVFFSAVRAGGMFVPVNWRLAAPEIALIIADIQPTVLVYDPAFREFVTGLSIPTLLSTGAELEAFTLGGKPGYHEHDIGLDDDAVVLYTSGTTGRPKGAVLSHGNVTFNTVNQLAHTDVLSTDVVLCVSPLFHATGLGQVSLPTLFKGGTVIVLPKFDAETVLRLVESEGIAAFSVVPTMLQLMAEHPFFDHAELGSLRYVISGGSALPAHIADAWRARGVELLQGYGMTEASPGVTMTPPAGFRSGADSVGVPHFFTDVRIAPAAEETGELHVRGLNVFRGYWRNAEENARAITEGWYRTGDAVRIDADGWVSIIDRLKDMFISGGENVYPAEVEAAIGALPGIIACALIGVPDDRWGEVGRAFVIADPSASWDEQGLRDRLRAELAAFKIPREVRFVNELPRTATGKVRREDLRKA